MTEDLQPRYQRLAELKQEASNGLSLPIDNPRVVALATLRFLNEEKLAQLVAGEPVDAGEMMALSKATAELAQRPKTEQQDANYDLGLLNAQELAFLDHLLKRARGEKSERPRRKHSERQFAAEDLVDLLDKIAAAKRDATDAERAQIAGWISRLLWVPFHNIRPRDLWPEEMQINVVAPPEPEPEREVPALPAPPKQIEARPLTSTEIFELTRQKNYLQRDNPTGNACW